jgi:hypothetical protein
MADEPRMTQEQIDRLMAQIEKVERKRKILLAGYLVALAVLVCGQGAAFWVFATAPHGTFFGWVFIVPFAFVGTVLWLFGRWAGRSR